MKMKLVEAIQNLSVNDLSNLEKINKAIQDRFMWLELKEPDDDGSAYDAWESKYDDFEEIYDKSTEILNNVQNKNYDMNTNIMELKELIKTFQLIYGGLSRLNLND